MNYKTGIIYKIICNIDSRIVYIGSTMKTLDSRLARHFTQYKLYKQGLYGYYSIYKYFDKYGINNFTIIKIKEYNVCDKLHLCMYEMLWMNKTKKETQILINKYHSFNIFNNTKLLNIINNNNKYYVENKDKIKFEKCCKCGLMFKFCNIHIHQKSNKCKKIEKFKTV